MKKGIVFGGTGGLGSQLIEQWNNEDLDLIGVGSKDVDITSYKEVSEFFKESTFDVVINLAGYNYDSFIHKYSDDVEINKQIQININGTVNILTHCLPYMRSNNYGRIVLASSVLAETPVISTGVYSGCKGFIDTITKTVSIENANKNISINSLQLGYFDGGLTYRIPESFREKIKSNIPMGRWGSIDEIKNTVDYLIKTPYITGQSIKISGGV